MIPATTSTRRNDKRQQRRATTLVEMMVVVAVSTILLGVVVTLLSALRTWDAATTKSTIHTSEFLRLAETLRADIRRASEMQLPSPTALVLTGPDDLRAEYTLNNEGCRKTTTSRLNGERSDAFSIGQHSAWLVATDVGRRPLKTVTLSQTAKAEQAAKPAPFIVCAPVGADVRPPVPAN